MFKFLHPEDLKTLPSSPSPSSARTGEGCGGLEKIFFKLLGNIYLYLGNLEKEGGLMKSPPVFWADASSCQTLLPSTCSVNADHADYYADCVINLIG